jgi:hypothetical protein
VYPFAGIEVERERDRDPLLTVPRTYPRLLPVLLHASLPEVELFMRPRIGYRSDEPVGTPEPTSFIGTVRVTLLIVFDCREAYVVFPSVAVAKR